jgi:hypothetical protein
MSPVVVTKRARPPRSRQARRDFWVEQAPSAPPWPGGRTPEGDSGLFARVAAIAGIGMKTRLRELASVGIKPILLMFGETVFHAVLDLVALR